MNGIQDQMKNKCTYNDAFGVKIMVFIIRLETKGLHRPDFRKTMREFEEKRMNKRCVVIILTSKCWVTFKYAEGCVAVMMG